MRQTYGYNHWNRWNDRPVLVTTTSTVGGEWPYYLDDEGNWRDNKTHELARTVSLKEMLELSERAP